MASKPDPVAIKPNYPTCTKETQAESKLTREVLTATVERAEPMDHIEDRMICESVPNK